MNNQIKEIFIKHEGKVADRWLLYLNEWDRILSPYRDQEINLLEIGVHNGGSLEIWSQYFKDAKDIIGCDIDEACQALKFEDPRIKIIIGDINSDDVKARIDEITPTLDIIIDDGSHNSEDIIKAFAHYFQKLSSGGVYLIEDLHASYWSETGGGLFNPFSAIAFLKRLVDLINFEHWQNDQSRSKFLHPFEKRYGVSFAEFDFYQLHSIEFINSLCLIHKRPPSENALGNRVVVGTQELIPGNYHKLDGTSIHDMVKEKVDDSNLDVFSLMVDTEEQEKAIETKEKTIEGLKNEIDRHTQRINQLMADIDKQKEVVENLKETLALQENEHKQYLSAIAEQRQINQESDTLIADQSRTILILYEEIELRDQSVRQMEAQLADEGKKRQASEHQLSLFKKKVSRLEHETLFYALSKSWRYTRPFRKIMGLLRGKRHA